MVEAALANQDVAGADLGDVKLGSQSPQLTRPDSAKQGHPTQGCQLLVQRATVGCPDMGTDLGEHVAPADLDACFCADHGNPKGAGEPAGEVVDSDDPAGLSLGGQEGNLLDGVSEAE